jgi:hypothetical protein
MIQRRQLCASVAARTRDERFDPAFVQGGLRCGEARYRDAIG